MSWKTCGLEGEPRRRAPEKREKEEEKGGRVKSPKPRWRRQWPKKAAGGGARGAWREGAAEGRGRRGEKRYTLLKSMDGAVLTDFD